MIYGFGSGKFDPSRPCLIDYAAIERDGMDGPLPPNALRAALREARAAYQGYIAERVAAEHWGRLCRSCQGQPAIKGSSFCQGCYSRMTSSSFRVTPSRDLALCAAALAPSLTEEPKCAHGIATDHDCWQCATSTENADYTKAAATADARPWRMGETIVYDFRGSRVTAELVNVEALEEGLTTGEITNVMAASHAEWIALNPPDEAMAS
jgi:hypothetical protein